MQPINTNYAIALCIQRIIRLFNLYPNWWFSEEEVMVCTELSKFMAATCLLKLSKEGNVLVVGDRKTGYRYRSIGYSREEVA